MKNYEREAINRLQYIIDKDASDRLLIFPTTESLRIYEKTCRADMEVCLLEKDYLEHTILMTETDFFFEPNKLVGRRIKSYKFMYMEMEYVRW